MPQPGNPQSLNRYAYANNSPIVYNDPSGHCPTCIGAVVGGVAGAGLYLWSESRQDGFNWRQDWRDLLVATGEGAVAGALIATPGGQAAGIGMAANLIGDHIENLVVGEDFSAAEHLVTGVSGAVEGAVGLRAVKSVGDAAKFLGLAGEEVIASKMLVQAGNAAVWGAAEGGVRAALDGKNAWAAAKSGAIQNGATEIFTFGALRSIELGRSSKAEQTFAELAHSTLPDTVITFGRSVKQGIDRQQAIIDARERQRSGR